MLSTASFVQGAPLQQAVLPQRPVRQVARSVTCGAQRLKGTVISTAMDKTAVVEIQNLEKHRIYSKLMRKTTKYFAHDPDNSALLGEEVLLIAVKPLSKMKRFAILRTLAESDIIV